MESTIAALRNELKQLTLLIAQHSKARRIVETALDQLAPPARPARAIRRRRRKARRAVTPKTTKAAVTTEGRPPHPPTSPGETRRRVLEFLRSQPQGAKAVHIQRALGISQPTTHAALRGLLNAGLAAQTKRGTPFFAAEVS